MDEKIISFFRFLEKLGERELPMKIKLLYYPEEITEDDLNVDESLDLRNSNLKTLPEGLIINGWLDISINPISFLPKNLKINGTLAMHNTNISSLPKGLIVVSNLHLRNTPLSMKYTREQIKQMCPGIKGNIYM